MSAVVSRVCRVCRLSIQGFWRSKQTMAGVESSDYFGQPLRQWVLPDENKVQRRAGGDLVLQRQGPASELVTV